jgi:hypothetical protein
VNRLSLVVLLVPLIAGCGKVGDVQPPITRTPQWVTDLKVSQIGYNAVLAWTNPGFYVDGNAATDITTVRILQNERVVSSVASTGAGHPQAAEIDISKTLDADIVFAVQVVTQRGKTSPVSRAVSLRTLDVPGAPRNLHGAFDQFRVSLEWDTPERSPELVSAYVVSRTDRPTPTLVRGRRFEDAEYEPDKTYTYTVTAVRGDAAQTQGLTSAPVSILTTDHTAPATPTGLIMQRVDSDVELRWTPNTERDLKEHLLYRSDSPQAIYHGRVEAFTDTSYKPGMTYQLSAKDTSDNESRRSDPVPGP